MYFCHFPIWCPGSGVVLDCIAFRYLPFLFCETRDNNKCAFY